FFFFQAEDGIRDRNVTGVQTCALPILEPLPVPNKEVIKNEHILKLAKALCMEAATVLELDADAAWEKVVTIVKKTGDNTSSMLRSEERRVGKEWRSWWKKEQRKKK